RVAGFEPSLRRRRGRGLGWLTARRQLIRTQVADHTNQIFEIQLMGHKIARDRLEQLGRVRRVRRAKIVHRVDESASQEIAPEAIDEGAREQWILLGGKPVGQRLTAIW